MRIEMMIYAYGAICVAMIFYNIAYNIMLKSSEPRLEKRCKRLRAQVDEHLRMLQQDGEIDWKQLKTLQAALHKVNELIAFDRVLEEVLQKDEELAQRYLGQLEPVFLNLAEFYKKKDTMQVGYFSYFLTKHIRTEYMLTDSLREVLLEYIRKDNLYCRVNGLEALYAIGDPAAVHTALKLQDDDKVFMHEKILTEGLLSFTGQHEVLARMLWDDLESFSTHTQLAILNYVRFKTDGYKEEMFAIMQDETKDKELRLSAIRYFGRYAYQPALQPLIDFAENKDPDKWEYATVSAGSLYRYSGEEVIQALKNALYSANWHVRFAASQSLETFHMDYEEMIDLLAGKDRYVREMVNYRLEHRRIKKRERTNNGRN